MKKNVMMRVASALLVAVLMTTSVISGTFAKYITTDNAQDSARVAKWGVTVSAEGSLFEKSYVNAPEADEDTATVVANETVDVVAPGTNNADDAFKFSITGQPEVDVKVDVVVTENTNDVFLKANTYEKLTTGNQDDEYVLAADYYPVKYKLTKQGATVVENATLAQLTTALENISIANVPANTNLATAFGEYEISWAWAYEGVNDDADTILGDLAAGSPAAGLNGAALTAGMDKDYNLSTGLKVAVTVTQVD